MKIVAGWLHTGRRNVSWKEKRRKYKTDCNRAENFHREIGKFSGKTHSATVKNVPNKSSM